MTVEQMRNDPNFVRVYDQYGQEVFLTRQQWQRGDSAGKPAGELGSARRVVRGAGQCDERWPLRRRWSRRRRGLYAIDTNPVRGACVYAIVLLQLGRID